MEALSASTPSNDSESLEGVTLSPRFRSLPRLDLHARAAELFSPGSGYRRVALNRFLSAYERQLKRNRGEGGRKTATTRRWRSEKWENNHLKEKKKKGERVEVRI